MGILANFNLDDLLFVFYVIPVFWYYFSCNRKNKYYLISALVVTFIGVIMTVVLFTSEGSWIPAISNVAVGSLACFLHYTFFRKNRPKK